MLFNIVVKVSGNAVRPEKRAHRIKREIALFTYECLVRKSLQNLQKKPLVLISKFSLVRSQDIRPLYENLKKNPLYSNAIY